jgi:hypothetical protein
MFASTHVRNCGISRDDKDTRGRWKGKGSVSDCYDDFELLYPDCKVAEKLCIGGRCCYMINTSICSSAAVLSTFILTKVVPNIHKQLPDSTLLVLGKALLWLVLYSVANDFPSQDLIDKVKGSLRDTGIEVLNGQNPVVKMPVLVIGAEGTVYIDELVGDVGFGVPGDAGGGGAVAGQGVDDEGKAAGVPAGEDE